MNANSNLQIATGFSALVSFAGSNFAMKSINSKAPVMCRKIILVNASPEKAWTALSKIDQWANWQTNVSKAKLNGPLKPGASFDWKTGSTKIHSMIHTVDPFSRFGWTGKTVGMYAIHNWTFTEVNGQTQISVEESMEGFLARLLKNMLNKNLEKDMTSWLALLKAECEK